MIKYLKLKEALFIHSVIIDETGGTHGIRDQGLIESACARPQQSFGGKDLYPSIEKKAAALVTSLTKNHPFIDGNKRTAAVCLGIFLELNRKKLSCSNDALVKFILDLSTDFLTENQAIEWIRFNS